MWLKPHSSQNHICHKIIYGTTSHSSQNHNRHKTTSVTKSHPSQNYNRHISASVIKPLKNNVSVTKSYLPQQELVLRPGSTTFEWWARPPVRPFVNVYVYNVTNADEFLNNGSKPVLNELGPYVYSEEWEKVNIVDNEDGTISFRYKRTYTFQPELSIGADNDMVVVPNIPMLSATSQSKHASMFLRLALASVMDILKIKPFVEVSVGQLLWGYEDPFLRLAKDVVPKEQRVPYEEFGLFYGKNSTSPDVVTMFNGATNTSLYGIIDRYDTKDKLSHWTNERCNSIAGSDGWIFPPHINKNDTLEIYDKDFCRLLPLKYLHDVESASGLHGYRFTPPEDVFANNEANECFCPDGAPCAPDGLFNVTLCRYDSPIMLSFPHFYLADPKLLDAVEGISPPVAEKHRFYIDVKPEIGIAIQARARIQINLAVSRVTDIKQLANFPDIVFPIMWYEEGIDESPSEVTSLLPGATKVPLSRDRLQEEELVLRPGSTTFEWWARPPVRPFVNVYVYNVTNADEFLNNGSKPVLNELGPYVYSEEWEKVNIVDNGDGTISFRYKRTYTFQPELSIGADDDMVVVPNIPMLSSTSQSKHVARFLRLALASIMDILNIKPFVEVSVSQLLWGYEDPLLKVAKDVVPKEQKLPYEEFGLFYGKNGTSPDVVKMFTGATNTSLYGIIDRYDMKNKLSHWTNERCNSIAGSDGWIFPPHINKNDTLEIYDKDFCRLLPLKYLHDVEIASGLHGYRFTPPEDVFANNEANECFCPDGAPCAPDGLFNVTLCRYDSPIMLSFPHFYLADPKLLDTVEGISPPVPEKHRFYIDVQPEIGIAIQARARIQINLAVSRVTDIKQLANFPDIVFPIMWYEEGIDELPSEVTPLLPMATKVSRDRLQEEVPQFSVSSLHSLSKEVPHQIVTPPKNFTTEGTLGGETTIP